MSDQPHIEKALQESERRFRDLADNVEQVFWMWNHTGVIYVNKAYETIWGRSCEELYREPFSWRDSVHPDDRERVVRALKEAPTASRDIEYRIIRPSGELRWIRDRVFPLIDEDGRVSRYAGVADDITETKQAEDALRLANRRLQILSRRRIQVQEQERRLLAIELHDQMGQTLTATRLALEAAKRIGQGPKHKQQLKQATELINQMTQQVRRMSFGLRPRVLDDLGLVAALRSLLTDSAQQTGWVTKFREPTNFPTPDDEVATTCFRIVGGALNNITRHAKAKNVSIEIQATDRQFTVKISDDGIGFDMAESEKRIQRDHLGLVGMSERASAVGGTFQCRSALATGTEITIALPYHAA